MDRTQDRAATKIKQANRQGLEAYRLLHKWYTGTGSAEIQAKRSKLITPPPVPEGKIIEATEAYELEHRELQELTGEKEVLPEEYRVIALTNMLRGKLKDLIRYNCSDIQNYDKLRDNFFTFAPPEDHDRQQQTINPTLNQLHQQPTWDPWANDKSHADPYACMPCDDQANDEQTLMALGKGKQGRKAKQQKGKTYAEAATTSSGKGGYNGKSNWPTQPNFLSQSYVGTVEKMATHHGHATGIH